MPSEIVGDSNSESKSIKVSALKQGTVIDHLKQGTALRTINILGLQSGTCTVMIGLSLESRTHGTKDLIKIENKELTQPEVNKIALLSPAATISIIRNYKVVDKIHPELPEIVEGLVHCTNPSCVTNHYSDVTSRFIVVRQHPIKLRCHFCERCFSREEIDLL
ncbi:MAG: aspartate carbamoyltransferase regulatory subunit [Planctomycetota bacterium]